MAAELLFREAVPSDLDAVMALYRACTAVAPSHGNDSWDENYPCREFAEEDVRNHGLFVLEQEGEIIGAVSLVPHDDWDEVPVWTVEPACSLSRLAILPAMQGRHLAQRLLEEVSAVAKARGYAATRHGSLPTNLPANRLYDRMGYVERGTAFLFGHEYRCLERIL